MTWMTTLANRIFARTARWPVIIVLALAFVGASVAIFSAVDRFDAVAGGLPLLEVPSFAPLSEIGATARAYPPEALRIYQAEIQPLDIIFPLTAGLLFGNIIYALVVSLAGAASPWRALSLLGPAMILTDYLENLGVFIVLRSAAAPPPGSELLIRASGALKFLVGIPAIVSILLLTIALLVRRLDRARGRPSLRPER